MAGSLWRQRPEEREARQLTDGPGYDYQPDWSPDGRRVVYASYRDDAIELRLLDLASGESTPLVSDSAVNIEPRWSPDGRRVAYTSSAHEGLWHVFVVRGGPGRRRGRSRSGSHPSATAACRATTTTARTSTSRRPGRPTGAS